MEEEQALVSSPAEKRLTTRKAFRKPVGFEKISPEPNRIRNIREGAISFNISKSGVGLISGLALRAGELVKLSIPLINKEVVIPVLAEVVWTQSTNDHFKTGLRFLL